MRSTSQFVYEGICEGWKKSICEKNIKINSKKSLFSRAPGNTHAKLWSTVLEPITNMAEMFWNKMQASFTTAEHWIFFSLTQIAKFWWKKIIFMRKKTGFFLNLMQIHVFFEHLFLKYANTELVQNWAKIIFFTPVRAKIIWKRKFMTLYFLENMARSP